MGLIEIHPDSTSFDKLLAISGDNSVIMIADKQSGNIVRSTDSGTTWTASTVNNPQGITSGQQKTWQSIDISGDGKYVVLSNYYALYTSSDSGATLTPVVITTADNYHFSDVVVE